MGNTAGRSGGGISSIPAVDPFSGIGSITIDGSDVSGNSVSGNTTGRAGGGIFSNGAVTLTNTTVSGNQCVVGANSPPSSYFGGGGVFAYGLLTLVGSTVTGTMPREIRLVAAGFLPGRRRDAREHCERQ